MHVTVNGQLCELPASATVQALLKHLKLAERPVAVELNLQVVPREQLANRTLHDGDCVEVVTLVGGG